MRGLGIVSTHLSYRRLSSYGEAKRAETRRPEPVLRVLRVTG
jgi:hypothetical protein